MEINKEAISEWAKNWVLDEYLSVNEDDGNILELLESYKDKRPPRGTDYILSDIVDEQEELLGNNQEERVCDLEYHEDKSDCEFLPIQQVLDRIYYDAKYLANCIEDHLTTFIKL